MIIFDERYFQNIRSDKIGEKRSLETLKYIPFEKFWKRTKRFSLITGNIYEYSKIHFFPNQSTIYPGKISMERKRTRPSRDETWNRFVLDLFIRVKSSQMSFLECLSAMSDWDQKKVKGVELDLLVNTTREAWAGKRPRRDEYERVREGRCCETTRKLNVFVLIPAIRVPNNEYPHNFI